MLIEGVDGPINKTATITGNKQGASSAGRGHKAKPATSAAVEIFRPLAHNSTSVIKVHTPHPPTPNPKIDI